MTNKVKEDLIHEAKRLFRTGLEFAGLMYMHYVTPEKTQIIKVNTWFEGNILIVGMVIVLLYPIIYRIFTMWKFGNKLNNGGKNG